MPSAFQEKQHTADCLGDWEHLVEWVTYLEEALEANNDRLDELISLMKGKVACDDSSCDEGQIERTSKEKDRLRTKTKKQRMPTTSPDYSSVKPLSHKMPLNHKTSNFVT